MNKTSYRLVKFGEYKNDGLWRNTETFKTHAEAYEVYGKIFRELNSDPTLRGAAVIRTDDEKDSGILRIPLDLEVYISTRKMIPFMLEDADVIVSNL